MLLKIGFGFLSDKVPIKGLHRKPYLLLGMICFSLSIFLLGFTFTLENFGVIILLFFGAYLGYSVFDSMTDGIILDQQQGNNLTTVATFQLSNKIGAQVMIACYLIFVGSNIQEGSWSSFFWILTGVGCILFFVAIYYHEMPHGAFTPL
jgi:Na+/melibiose symporter-like transporter